MKYSLVIAVVSTVFAYIFYRSIIAFVIFMAPTHLYFKIIKGYRIRKRRQELTVQFKEFCMSLCAQLMAGYSIENGVSEAYIEMMQMYDNNSYICRELKFILAKLKLNLTIEECFKDLAVRSNIEEIKLFAEIIKIANRSGGDIIEIVRNAADSISQKIEVEREIRIIINSKKYEQRIMDVVPLLIVMYVNVTSQDMMEIMYKGFLGRIIMTGCLLVYMAAFVLGEKMTDIEI